MKNEIDKFLDEIEKYFEDENLREKENPGGSKMKNEIDKYQDEIDKFLDEIFKPVHEFLQNKCNFCGKNYSSDVKTHPCCNKDHQKKFLKLYEGWDKKGLCMYCGDVCFNFEGRRTRTCRKHFPINLMGAPPNDR